MEITRSLLVVLVVALFILTFIVQPFRIPSESMERTLLVGDFLLVNKITFAPAGQWGWLLPYRDIETGDVVVFHFPPDPPEHVVKRVIGVPGDHIHLHNGIVILNGVAQPQPYAQPTTADNYQEFLDEFPSLPPYPQPGGATEAWAVDFPNHVVDGDLVVPPGMYFMMGDNRHDSLDSRFWGFVPRQNIVGRALFNYWSFVTPDSVENQTGIGPSLAWMGHVVLHFFTETRWSRTFHLTR